MANRLNPVRSGKGFFDDIFPGGGGGIPGLPGMGGGGLPGLPGMGGGKKSTPAPAAAPAAANTLTTKQKQQVRNQVKAVIDAQVKPDLDKIFKAVSASAAVPNSDPFQYNSGALGQRVAFSSGEGFNIGQYIPLLLIGAAAWFFLKKR